jgi:cytochrome b561
MKMETQKYSAVYKIMHWAIAFCILFMLFTIFLRLTWLNKVHVSDILGEELAQRDVNLTSEELIKIAKKIRKPMWEWHVYIGYVLIGLYVIRLILPFFGQMKFKSPLQEKTIKRKFQQWTYVFFYVGLTVTLATGFLIVNGPPAWKDGLEGVHELSLYYILAFIVTHFTGILLAEYGAEKGIISRIIGR